MEDIIKSLASAAKLEDLIKIRNQRYELLKQITNKVPDLHKSLQREISILDDLIWKRNEENEFGLDEV